MTDVPIIIRHHAPMKLVLMILFGLMMSAFGVWALMQPDQTFASLLAGGVVAFLGALATIQCLAQIWRPTFLVIRVDGIEQTGFMRQPHIPWEAIAEIVSWRDSLRYGGTTHVGCLLTEAGYEAHALIWQRALGLGRYDRWIMNGHGDHIARVIRLLREHHQRAVDRSLMGSDGGVA